MKKFRSIIIIFICVLFVSTNRDFVCAADTISKGPNANLSVEIEDSALENAKFISEESCIKKGRMITTKIYKQSDGTMITDVFDVSARSLFSKNGSDVTTRTRVISGWGTVSITAGFRWYTKGLFSYVKCTSMSASRSINSKAAVGTWETSYTDNYVSIGKAKAQVKYYFYNKSNPTQFQDGTFKITCSDSGTISDNN